MVVVLHARASTVDLPATTADVARSVGRCRLTFEINGFRAQYFQEEVATHVLSTRGQPDVNLHRLTGARPPPRRQTHRVWP